MQQEAVIEIKPEGCDAYRVPDLKDDKTVFNLPFLR